MFKKTFDTTSDLTVIYLTIWWEEALITVWFNFLFYFLFSDVQNLRLVRFALLNVLQFVLPCVTRGQGV